MAAYEDFEFFRTTRLMAAPAAPRRSTAPTATADSAPDALRSELLRLNAVVRRLRAHHRVRRGRRWPARLRRLVRCLLPISRGAA
ncbi:MAG: hypothetical protein FJ293_02080 [Planctomycetes bacterium]|nr:hypothetical protein [Planctomycetota bacterium]